jgi:hypothetical protein
MVRNGGVTLTGSREWKTWKFEGMVPFGDAINAFQELGFEITGVFPLSREFDNLRVIEFDFVFMRHGS